MGRREYYFKCVLCNCGCRSFEDIQCMYGCPSTFEAMMVMPTGEWEPFAFVSGTVQQFLQISTNHSCPKIIIILIFYTYFEMWKKYRLLFGFLLNKNYPLLLFSSTECLKQYLKNGHPNLTHFYIKTQTPRISFTAVTVIQLTSYCFVIKPFDDFFLITRT